MRIFKMTLRSRWSSDLSTTDVFKYDKETEFLYKLNNTLQTKKNISVMATKSSHYAFTGLRNISINFGMVEKMSKDDYFKFLLLSKGFNYHEFAHILYTKYGQVNWDIRESINKLEDQRIELMFAKKYKKAGSYFQMLVLSLIKKHGLNDDVYSQIYGRRFFIEDKELIKKVKELFIKSKGLETTKKVEEIIDTYLVTTDIEKQKSLAFELRKLIGSKPNLTSLTTRNGKGTKKVTKEEKEQIKEIIEDMKEETEVVKEEEENNEQDSEDDNNSENENSESDDSKNEDESEESETGSGQGDSEEEGETDSGSGSGDKDEESKISDENNTSGSGKESEDDSDNSVENDSENNIKGNGNSKSSSELKDELNEKMDKILDDVKDDFEEEIESQMERMDKHDFEDTNENNDSNMIFTPEEKHKEMSKKLERQIKLMRNELDSSIVTRQRKGRVDMRRVMSNNSYKTDDFKRFLKSKLNKTKLGVSLILDSSGSVKDSDFNTIIGAGWSIAKALEETNSMTKIYEFSDEYRVVKEFDKTVSHSNWGRNYNNRTDVCRPLEHTEKSLELIKKQYDLQNLVVFILTDGVFDDVKRAEKITLRLKEKGVYVVLLRVQSDDMRNFRVRRKIDFNNKLAYNKIVDIKGFDHLQEEMQEIIRDIQLDVVNKIRLLCY